MTTLGPTRSPHPGTLARLILGSLLLLGGMACATSGMSASKPAATRSYAGGSHAEVVQAVAEVVDSIDAQVLRLATDDEAQVLDLELTQDWRQPRPESAVLRVVITGADAGVQVTLQADVLANAAADNRAPRPESQEETARSSGCSCSRDQEKGASTRLNSALALANMHRTMGAFLDALDAHDLPALAALSPAVAANNPREGD